MSKSYQGKILYDADLLRGSDKAGWEAAVLKNLNELWNARSGRAVLNQVIRSSKQIKIVPWYAADVNAATGARSYRDAYYKNRPLRSGADGHHNPAWGVGTGRGSDVRLEFTPWRYPANRQSVTLVHELTHATEQLGGVFYTNPMNWHFDTVAEFDAIVVENIYRSEKGLTLRANHWGHSALTASRMIPHGGELEARLASFKARMPQLTDALAQIDVPFNPLRWAAKGSY